MLHKHALIPKLFHDLRFVIIDEVHSLLRGDRGGQCLCLIERLSDLAGCDPRRIGLSATIGDLMQTADYLSTGSGRHTDKQEFIIAPDDIRPELLDCAGNDRTAPDNRVLRIFQQQIDAHNIRAELRSDRKNTGLIALGALLDAKHFRHRRTRDIGIEDTDRMTAALYGDRSQRRNQRLSDAALAADDRDHLADLAQFMRFFMQVLRLTARASLSAGRTVVCAFAHKKSSFRCYDTPSIPQKYTAVNYRR